VAGGWFGANELWLAVQNRDLNGGIHTYVSATNKGVRLSKGYFHPCTLLLDD
jgi:hypothetical protein